MLLSCVFTAPETPRIIGLDGVTVISLSTNNNPSPKPHSFSFPVIVADIENDILPKCGMNSSMAFGPYAYVHGFNN